MELSEQEIVRRQSLQAMRDLGIDPYPAAEYVVTGYSIDIKDQPYLENEKVCSASWKNSDTRLALQIGRKQS